MFKKSILYLIFCSTFLTDTAQCGNVFGKKGHDFQDEKNTPKRKLSLPSPYVEEIILYGFPENCDLDNEISSQEEHSSSINISNIKKINQYSDAQQQNYKEKISVLKTSFQKEKSSESTLELSPNMHSFTLKEVNRWVKAAARGDLSSMYHLGHYVDQEEKAKQLLLEEDKSRVVLLDKARTFYWWTRAQQPNDTKAHNKIGELYLAGCGVEKNNTEAKKWFLKAADQNNPDAQSALGFIYQNGLGVEKNNTEAKKWFLKATENNK